MRHLLAGLAVLSLSACATAPAPAPDKTAGPLAAPPAETSVVEAKPAPRWTSGAMVAAANPLAVEAGLEVLRAGGSAVDAAIAVQTTLSLVEPQSSGIGGGAFMLHYDAATGDVVAYDGREVAPAGATPTMFLRDDGKPMSFFQAVQTGRSVGVPGVIAMLELAHGRHGKLPWAQSFQPAIKLSRDGFPVSERLSGMVGDVQGFLTRTVGPDAALAPDAAAYLTLDGKTPLPAGHILKNAAYADSLALIARDGARAFYTGPLAEQIVAAAQKGPMGGTLSMADMAAYRANAIEPVCRPYRVYLVCGMRPPSSGGIAVLGILGVLENLDMAATSPQRADGWHRFIEASRMSYADRDMYVADDRFVAVPIDGLLDRDYLKSRAALIQPDKALPKIEAGDPPGAVRRGRDATGNIFGTSHFVVVDAKGNVVSMTTTVEAPFGSQRMAGGFFINNQLTDFSFRPTDDQGQPIANAVAPGKKPRSSMSPTIIFKDGAFQLAVGSPGGNSIIGYVAKTIVGVLDWGLTPQAAIDLPNVVARGTVAVERARMDPAILKQLQDMGHQIRDGRGAEGSGLHAVMVGPDGKLVGGADSRREGVARAP
jgi:gamma-glutamyltranspeptidase/glutathione hydrolase